MAPQETLMNRHKTRGPYNSIIQYPIGLRLHMLHQGSVLNTSVSHYCVILIAPPTGESGSLHNSYIYNPIITKMFTVDDGPVLSPSINRY